MISKFLKTTLLVGIFSISLNTKLSLAETLSIFHINDANGNLGAFEYPLENGEVKEVGGMTRLAYFLKKRKEVNNNYFFVSSGDMLAPIPITARSKGEIMINLLNQVGLEVWSPGNYDFLYGVEELNKRIAEAKFEVVNSNIFLKKDGSNWIKPYTILEKNGKKIAFLGATSLKFYNYYPEELRKTIEVKPILPSVKELAQKLKKEVDLVVLIAQMPVTEKSEILLNTEVDLIIGGIDNHEESNISSFATFNEKLSVVTPGYLLSVGEVDLDFEKDKVSKKAFQNFLDITKYPLSLLETEVPDILQTIRDYKIAYRKIPITSFSKAPDIIESQKFSVNIGRVSTNSELAIIDKSFFLRGGRFNKEITEDTVKTVVHLPFKLVKLKISGGDIKDFINNHNKNDFVISGLKDNKINGVNIKETEKYTLLTTELMYKKSPFLKERTEFITYLNSLDEYIFNYIKTNENREIDLEELDNYNNWKFNFNLDLDPQVLNVELPKEGKYNYLTWKGDQSDIRYGGVFNAFLRRYWDKNEVESTLEGELRLRQYSQKPLEKASDRLKLNLFYRREVIKDYLYPFLGSKLSSVFVNPDPKKSQLLLGEFNLGLSHNLPFNIRFEEGLELRKDLLDNKLPWKIGGIFQLNTTQNLFFVRNDLLAKIYIPFSLDGNITEIENKITIPIGSVFNIFYKTNLYNESNDFKYWAIRHNLGINFNFNTPFSF